jgi:hypothetical protein
MSAKSKNINQNYLKLLTTSPIESVYGRIYKFWWSHFLTSIKQNGIDKTLNTLDKCMTLGNTDFLASATKYASAQGFTNNSGKYIQIYNQYVKSNTGKMFERFAGLALAYSLQKSESNYCIVQFNAENVTYCHGLQIKDFEVKVVLGKKKLPTHIDADLIAFNPTNTDSDIFLISVKSTLKDRFHNVPFWNLLRRAAVLTQFKTVQASNKKLLEKVKYIAICSDLAKEQPDFASQTGPRNMLCIDAALLDGAFVSASNAHGLGRDKGKFGHDRLSAFYPLSSFYRLLL